MSKLETETEKSGTSKTVTYTDTQTGHTDAIDFAKVRLPSFWPNNPSTWFIQAEAQFNVFRLTRDETKYCLTIAALPPETCESVIDIIADPPATDKYQKLKTTLISRHSASESKRLEELLEKVELGNQKPSALFRSMKQTAGGTFDSNIIKKLWLRRLPQAINIALVSVGDKPTDEMIALADKIFEATENASSSSINAVSNNFSRPAHNRDSSIERRLSRLEHLLSKIDINSNSNRRDSNASRIRSRSRSNNNKNSQSNKNLCYYHKKFGDKARKCACTKVINVNNSTTSAASPN